MDGQADMVDATTLESIQDVPLSNSDDVVWKASLAKVVPSVVVLKVTLTRAVDTESASSSYATGFIVDKARGIILTNRHVITPGPVVAEAIFLNREELPVYPLYADPVHDFGFFRFDPSKVQFMDVEEVPLAPEGASVGLDIRVVGNDSGEKVSILAGVLARLDRDAPSYGRKGYNDFNTFYLQAASGTKGGSSGSPVIDRHGRAVGLNAGGKNKAASAYYLPLERVVRALRLIQGSKVAGSPANLWSAPCIPRGDLQTTLTFKGFDEVRRLGLRQETERAVRAAPCRTHGSAGDEQLCTTGMLVVELVLPGGPADGVLEAGDVLVKVNGEIVTHFLHLEEIMDDFVGKEVTITLERGGQSIEAKLVVADIHAVTPSTFLEVSGGTVQALSYQQARNNRVVPGQVYVAESGYMLGRASVPKHAIITALNNVPTPTLEAFGGVLRGLSHGARVPLEYYTFHERHRRKNAIMHMDRQWYGAPVHWVRDDAAGCWHPTTNWPPGAADPAPHPPSPAANGHHESLANGQDKPTANGHSDANGVADVVKGRGGKSPRAGKSPAAKARAAELSEGLQTQASDAGETLGSKLEDRLRDSMVLVDVDIPLVALADGVHARSFAGNGIIVHHGPTLGLVVVDRNTITVGPCDVALSFGAHPSEVPGTVRFLHPLLNFAIVSYDPQLLPEEARKKVRAAELLCNPPIRRGETVHLAGLTKFLRIMQRKSTVTTATSAITIPMPEVPRFRAVHEEVIKLDHDFGATFSGVLTDEAGRVRALWGSYSEQVDKEEREWCSGLPTDSFYPWVQRLLALEQDMLAGPPTVRTLDAELEALLLSKAAQFNLPREWVSRLDQLDPERRQVLRVRSTVANSHAAQVLQSGDMLLAIAGKPVSCFRDVESLVAEHNGVLATAANQHTNSAVKAEVKATKEGAGSGRKRKAAIPASPAQSPRKGRQPASGAKPVTPTNDMEIDQSAAAGPSDSAEPADTTITVMDDAGVEDGDIASPRCNGHAGFVPNTTDPTARPHMPITIFRGGKILELSVQLGEEDGMGTSRLVHWCGAQLQAPHRGVRELGFLPETAGVYISRWHHGSPAHRYGLYALHWIAEVNGHATPDLDTFLKVVAPLRDGDFVRIKMCHLETAQPKVLTLKMDLAYWPTWELRLQPQKSCKWKRVCMDPLPAVEDTAAPELANGNQ